jgi:hypothetical protein
MPRFKCIITHDIVHRASSSTIESTHQNVMINFWHAIAAKSEMFYPIFEAKIVLK